MKYLLQIYTFKYHEIIIEVALEEEEEEVGRPQDRGDNKRVHVYHLSIILYP